MMHTKAIVVDGVVSTSESANFDNRSLKSNNELNVAVASPDPAARLSQDFVEDLRHTKRLELQEWRHRSLLEKTREYFWSYFGEIF